MASGNFLQTLNGGYAEGTEQKKFDCDGCAFAGSCDGSTERHLENTNQEITPDVQDFLDRKTTLAEEGLDPDPEVVPSPVAETDTIENPGDEISSQESPGNSFEDDDQINPADNDIPQESLRKLGIVPLQDLSPTESETLQTRKSEEIDSRAADHSFLRGIDGQFVKINGVSDILAFGEIGVLEGWDETQVKDGGITKEQFEKIVSDLETQGYSINEIFDAQGTYTGYFLWERTAIDGVTSAFYEVRQQEQLEIPIIESNDDEDLDQEDDNHDKNTLDGSRLEDYASSNSSPIIKTPLQLFNTANTHSKTENGISLQTNSDVIRSAPDNVQKETSQVLSSPAQAMPALHTATQALPTPLRAIFEQSFLSESQPAQERLNILIPASIETTPVAATKAIEQSSKSAEQSGLALGSAIPETSMTSPVISSPIYRGAGKIESATENVPSSSNPPSIKQAEKLSGAPTLVSEKINLVNETSPNTPNNAPPSMEINSATGETRFSAAEIKTVPARKPENTAENRPENPTANRPESQPVTTQEHSQIESPGQIPKQERVPNSSGITEINQVPTAKKSVEVSVRPNLETNTRPSETVVIPIITEREYSTPRTKMEIQRDDLDKQLASARQALRILAELRSTEVGRQTGNGSTVVKAAPDEIEIDSKVTPLQPTAAAEQPTAIAA